MDGHKGNATLAEAGRWRGRRWVGGRMGGGQEAGLKEGRSVQVWWRAVKHLSPHSLFRLHQAAGTDKTDGQRRCGRRKNEM